MTTQAVIDCFLRSKDYRLERRENGVTVFEAKNHARALLLTENGRDMLRLFAGNRRTRMEGNIPVDDIAEITKISKLEIGIRYPESAEIMYRMD